MWKLASGSEHTLQSSCVRIFTKSKYEGAGLKTGFMWFQLKCFFTPLQNLQVANVHSYNDRGEMWKKKDSGKQLWSL